MTRTRVLTVLTIIVAAGLLQPVRGQAPADAWPQFRGAPALTGVSAARVPDTLKVLWSYEAGESIDSSPAVADGVVYVTSASGDLLALNLADGQLKWKYTVELGFGESSPAVANGRVFVGDLGGVFHAVNATDGRAAWTFKTGSEIKSSPVVVGDLVLIGSYDGTLYGLNVADGKVRWQVRTENYVHGTPSVLDGVAYFAGATRCSARYGCPMGACSSRCRWVRTSRRRPRCRTASRISGRSTTKCSRSS